MIKRHELNGSFEKLVHGVSVSRMVSCALLKSPMEFCKSRILRRKSCDISVAGLITRGGAIGGPESISLGVWRDGDDGGGCRAR